jgi:hypothetical protein
MKFWVVEIRDEATCIPALAIQMLAEDYAADYWIHGRCGHPRDGTGLALMKLTDGQCHFDPYDWVGNRTMTNAHNWMRDNMGELVHGGVVDVRFILGEADKPAESEVIICPF